MALDALSSVTQRHIIPLVVDQVLRSNPTLALMFQHTQFLDGGTIISQPIVVAKNTTPSSYLGAETLATSYDDEITSLEFNWAQYYATITFTGLDDARNNGEDAIANLLKIKSQIAEYSLRETMGTDLQGDGTGNGGKAMV
ncbi:MAG TPA: phage major capsid protein, partial [bacterium]|nr:phage major capsid protein [bacterium]